MKDKLPLIIIGVVTLLIVIGGAVALSANANKPGKLDGFAQCLKDKGVTFFGAFWCPHCKNQKKMFGNSAKLLPYTECSTADGKAQTQECIDKNIASYPTWEFADGSRETGEVSLEKLAEKSSCQLP